MSSENHGSTLKIAFLIRGLECGGAERQLITLSKGLHARGHEIIVLPFYSEGALEKELHEAGVRVFPLNKKHRWDIFDFTWRALMFLNNEKVDFLHSYLNSANVLSIFLKPFLPKTKIVWGVRAANMNWEFVPWLSRFNFKASSWLAKYPDRIIVNSKAGLAYHAKRGYPISKMTFVPNGIDCNRFKPRPDERDRVRAKLGLLSTDTVIGAVGSIDPIKDHVTFVKAAKIFAKQHPGVKFVCLGKENSDYARSLRTLCDDLSLSNRFIWCTERLDIENFYNALDLLTSTSISEGFSNVVAEAMACGIPCVVTNVGDSSLIVGETGVVIPPSDPNALITGWVKALDLKQPQSGASTRQRILENFEVTQLVTRTEEVLWETL